MESDLKPAKYDRNAENYTNTIKKDAEHYLQTTVSCLHTDKNRKEMLNSLMLNNAFQKRRTAALCEYGPVAAEKFEKKYPELNIEDCLMQFTSVPSVCTPDIVNRTYNFLLAAALFILDELNANTSIDEALIYMPNDEKLINDMELPYDFHDACFDNAVIKSMMYLISQRDNTQTAESTYAAFINKETPQRTASNLPEIKYSKPQFYANSSEKYITIKKQLSAEAINMNCRERFNKILSLMRPVIINRATTRYKKKIWEYLDIVLDSANFFHAQRLDLIRQLIKEIDKMEKMIDRHKMSNNTKTQVFASKPKNVCAVNQAAIVAELPSIIPEEPSFMNPYLCSLEHKYSNTHLYNDAIACEKRIDKLINEINKLSDITYNFLHSTLGEMPLDGKIGIEMIKEVREKRVNNFHVDNPFEICFAFLWLLDRGDNIAWLGNITWNILRYAGELLPWHLTVNSSLVEIINNTDTKTCEEDYEPDIEDDPADDYDKQKSMYAKIFSDYFIWSRYDIKNVRKKNLVKVNFPQFVYGETSVNIPRNLDYFAQYNAGYKKSGFSGKNLDMLLMYLSLGDQITHPISFDILDIEENKQFETDCHVQENDENALKKIISKKNNEIAQLKQQLYTANKEKERVNKSAKDIESEVEANKQELFELREVIYKMQNESNDDSVETKIDIPLPYTAKSKLIIYGGHDSWLRMIKQLLPNVRVIPPSANPDVNLIRNADIIWMQSNAMPHSTFGKIMNVIRQNKIPVKYFAYASAEKCAKQLAEFDMENA